MPQRQLWLRQLPSQSGFWTVTMHFTATPPIPPPSTTLKSDSIDGSSGVEPRAFTADLRPPTHPLNPINPDNACTLRITAAAGTELAGAYSAGTVNAPRKGRFFPVKSRLQPRGPSSGTRHGWVRLAPIAQYSLLLPPVGVGPVSQCPCGGSPSQVPY